MSYGYDDDSKRTRRYVIISISSVLLISMVVAVTVGVTLNKNDGGSDGGDGEASASVKAVKDVCAPTDYKKTCEDTLMKNGKNSTDPMELVMTAFNATMKQIQDAAAKSQTLIELQKDPRTKMALDQCKELMNYAMDELKSSFDELGKFDYSKIDEGLINLRIWLSAAISHEETCLDGFQDSQGNAGETMKKALKTAVQLTHNGLAIVSELSNYLNQMQIPGLGGRRLLNSGGASSSGDHPSWVDGRARRLLSTPPRAGAVKADVVVAQDGSGQYTTINEALQQVPKNSNNTFVVYIKAGLYKEFVQIDRHMTHVMFIGDGADKTRISGSKGYKDGVTTFRTASAAIIGDHFIAKNIGFENTAGAIKHQAVAVRVQSDMAIFYNCSMDGYQDTLYAHSHRQFYRDCTISGTIDFLFGDAAAVFQNCTLVIRKPLENQACLVTANGRQDGRESTGFVFQGCTITAEPDYLAVSATNKAYLGRPWKAYSKTIIMNTFIPEFIQPEGWQPWNGDFALDTLFYSEVRNKGPGASLDKRVTWPGIKKLTQDEIAQFTPAQFIQGDTWVSGKGVPYTGGMLGNKHSGSPEASSTGSTTTDSASPAESGSTDSPAADSTTTDSASLSVQIGTSSTPTTSDGSSAPNSATTDAPAPSVADSTGSPTAPSSSFLTYDDTSGSISPSLSSASPSPSVKPSSSASGSDSSNSPSPLSYSPSPSDGSDSAAPAPTTSASAPDASAPAGSVSMAPLAPSN